MKRQQNNYRLLGPELVSCLERNGNMKYLPVIIKVIQNAGFSLPEEDKCIGQSKHPSGWDVVNKNKYIDIDDLLYYIKTPCDGYREFISFLEICHRRCALHHFFLIPNRYQALCRGQDLYKAPVKDYVYEEVLRFYKIQLGMDLSCLLVDPAYADCFEFEELPIETLCWEIERALIDYDYESIVARDIIEKVKSEPEVWGDLFKNICYLIKKGVLK